MLQDEVLRARQELLRPAGEHIDDRDRRAAVGRVDALEGAILRKNEGNDLLNGRHPEWKNFERQMEKFRETLTLSLKINIVDLNSLLVLVGGEGEA